MNSLLKHTSAAPLRFERGAGLPMVFILILVLIVGGLLGGLGAAYLGLSVSNEMTSAMSSSDEAGSGEPTPLYWVAPMDKNYRRDEPGLSPMGMELVPVYEEDLSGADGGIKISPTVENNLGVKTALPKRGRLTIPIQTVGTVQFDESRIRHIHSRVEGWVERVSVASSGEEVKAGQVLFELYAPTLVSAQEEYLAAWRRGNERLIRASRSRLEALGLTPQHIKSIEKTQKVAKNLPFVAERDGIVIALNVRQGMYIEPRLELMSLGTLDSVWVIGAVLERQAGLIQRAQDVVLYTDSDPTRTWRAMVNYIYPQLDQSTRTLPVRVRVHNPDHALKPNMLVNLNISSGGQSVTLNVPRSAVIKTRHHHRVVKALGDGRYRSEVVETGLEGDLNDGPNEEPYIQVLSGLDETEAVVVSAQFLIDSESNIDADLGRMEEPTEDAEPEALLIESTGVVNSVMSAMGMVNLTHAPIPELDWPEMTMNFPTGEALTLDQFEQGDEVRFQLWVDRSNGLDYRIDMMATKDGRVQAGPANNGMGPTEHDMSEMDMPAMNMHGMDMSGHEMPEPHSEAGEDER